MQAGAANCSEKVIVLVCWYTGNVGEGKELKAFPLNFHAAVHLLVYTAAYMSQGCRRAENVELDSNLIFQARTRILIYQPI